MVPTEELKRWVETRLVRVEQSSFRLETESGVVLAFDPFSASPLWTEADIVLVSHDHSDHFNAAVVRSLVKSGTRVVVPASMRSSRADRGVATDALSPGESVTVGPVKIEAVRAYNLNKPMHPKSKDYLGYVVAVDGLSVYHAGDTDLIPEMDTITADVALLPAGGLLTMNAAQAAEAARKVGARVAVPMHYGKIPFTGRAGKAFARLWEGTSVII